MKIAILGQGAGTENAPSDWIRWALTTDPINKHRADVLFQMHEMQIMQSCGTLDDLEDSGNPGPVYWQYPAEKRGETEFLQYPLEDVIQSLGRDWFASGISYMLGFAIHCRPDEIGLWGIHMQDIEEYRHQRQNLCWMIGLAEGRGIKVTLPEGNNLVSYNPQFSKYPKRYGYTI